MKKILVVLVGVAVLAGCAGMTGQRLSAEDASVEKVYEAPGLTQKQIYDGARLWIAQTFKDAKKVIELEDPEAGIIIGNGNMAYPATDAEKLWVLKDERVFFSIRIDTKDGKFRMRFSEIHLDDLPLYEGHMTAIRPKLLAVGDELAASLGSEQAESDW